MRLTSSLEDTQKFYDILEHEYPCKSVITINGMLTWLMMRMIRVSIGAKGGYIFTSLVVLQI